MGAKTVAVLFCPLSRRADLVARFHEGFGHVGKTTVFDLLRKRWWWSTMPQDITDWLSSCPQCQLASGANKKQHCAPMVPSSIPTAFSRWHLDFVGELHLTQKGNRWLLSAVDFSTNWPIARAVPDATAETLLTVVPTSRQNWLNSMLNEYGQLTSSLPLSTLEQMGSVNV
ncbi:hypothetical protein G6F67_009614 [Rhizopus microsporus]|nr:hypothetical protein G6F67_009614 [Rhizopus microsporus]